MILSALSLYSMLCLAQQSSLTLQVDRLHVGDGQVLKNAIIQLENGKIVSVEEGATSTGALHISGAELTPGLIDAFSYMGVSGQSVEESRESTPSLRLAHTLRVGDPAFRHALSQGVTAAFLSPDSLNVIGGLGAVVKTGGGTAADLFAEEQSAARILNPEAALKITLGNDASWGNFTPNGRFTRNFRARRPNTRMGTVWVVRREFYRAKDYLAARHQGTVAYDPDLEVLADVLEGKIPVRVQARRSHDVQTALRLQKEFGWPRLTIEEGTESQDAAPNLAAAGVAVITGPAYDSSQRAIARGPSAAKLKQLAHPPAVCCEDLHDIEGLESGMEDSGLVPVSDRLLDWLVVLAPRYGAASGLNGGRFSEGGGSTPALPVLLQKAGVTLAMGSAEAHDQPLTEASLIYQARNAVRWGMDQASALAAITSQAAQLCGMGQRLGQIKSGYDADLVLWSGPPLDSDSRPLLVILDGRIVVDNRPQE